MKKSVITLAALAMTAQMWAGSITWVSADLSAYNLEDGWLVALYEDVSANGFNATSINFSTGATDSDDALLGITTTITLGKAGTIWGSLFDSPAGSLSLGDSVVSVVFNSATMATATTAWYTSAFDGGLSANAGGAAMLPSSNIDATYSTTALTQVVPEPTTFMLLGFGGGLAWLVRKRQSFFL